MKKQVEEKNRLIFTLVPNPYVQESDPAVKHFSVFITPRIVKDSEENPVLVKTILSKIDNLMGNNKVTLSPYPGSSEVELPCHRVPFETEFDRSREELWNLLTKDKQIDPFKTEYQIKPPVTNEKILNNLKKKVNNYFNIKISNLSHEKVEQKNSLRKQNAKINLNIDALKKELMDKPQIFSNSSFWNIGIPTEVIREFNIKKEINILKNDYKVEKYSNLLSTPNNDNSEIKFHEMISMLGEYPLILRYLGLIMDFTLNISSIKGSNINYIRITIDKEDDQFKIETPLTYLESLDSFTPGFIDQENKNSYLKIKNGYVIATNSKYNLIAEQYNEQQFLLNNLILSENKITDTNRSDVIEKILAKPLSSNTSDGIGIKFKFDNGITYKAKENFNFLEQNDLDVGYRVDVSPDGRNFYSLCRRKGDYYLDLNENGSNDDGFTLLNNYEDEHWISESAQLGSDKKSVYLNEELCRWNNWSLVCHHMGEFRKEKNGQHNILKVDSTPLDLIKLRFGSEYWFRLRTVDLCGNGPSEVAPVPEEAIFKLTGNENGKYKRYEPLNPPDLFLTENIIESKPDRKPMIIIKKDFEGENLTNIIIKSNVTRIYHQGKESSRTISPSKVPIQFAELHGVFDDIMAKDGDKKSKTKLYKMACYNKKNNSDEIHDDTYSGTEEIPFITDPGVGGYSIFITDSNKEVISGIWETDYINRKFRSLIIKPGTRLNFKNDNGNLEITIEPGGIYDAKLSSVMSSRFDKIVDDNSADNFKTLKLVHAVQKPVVVINDMVIYEEEYDLENNIFSLKDRKPDQVEISFNYPSSKNRFPVKCCREFILSAKYKDIQVNRFSSDKGYQEVSRELSKSFYIEKTENFENWIDEKFFDSFESKLEHSFGDSKFRKVCYSLEAVSKFTNYFPNMKEFSCFGKMGELIVKNSKKPDELVIDSIVPLITWITTGSIVKRVNNKFRIYFRGDWYLTGDEEKVAILFLDGKNTINEDYEGLVSELGKDPTLDVKSQNLNTGMNASFFPRGITILDNLKREILKESITESTESLNIFDIKAAIYSVEFDKESDRFYADISINLDYLKGNNYFSFLKLAVARYQEHSIIKHENSLEDPILYDFRFSKVAMAPQVQILPEIEIDKENWKFLNCETRTRVKKIEQYLILENKSMESDAHILVNEKNLESTIAIPLYVKGRNFREEYKGSNHSFDSSYLQQQIKNFGAVAVYLEEFEVYKVNEDFKVEGDYDTFNDFDWFQRIIMKGDFEIPNEFYYNPRNDIRKRLVFTYKLKYNYNE